MQMNISIKFVGKCTTTYRIIPQKFQEVYHTIYTSVFFVCVVIVSILYILIFKSLKKRRSERAKNRALPLVTLREQVHEDEAPTQMTGLNGADGELLAENGRKKSRRDKRKSTVKRDRNAIANLKTALMLFVVTVVFIVTYFPACLMALDAIDYSAIIFYLYFANNAANPIIYSFMNKNFRDDLKRIFNCN